MKSPRLGKRRTVYQNRYHSVYAISVNHGGLAKEFFVTDYGKRAGLIIAKGDAVLLVRQYRLLINAQSWEIPGGRVDSTETPKQAAIREAIEETGLVCRKLKPLVLLQPGLDTLHNPTHVFYTDDFEEAPAGMIHHDEIAGQRWFPVSQCLRMIQSGKIMDSLSIASLLAFNAFVYSERPPGKETAKRSKR